VLSLQTLLERIAARVGERLERQGLIGRDDGLSAVSIPDTSFRSWDLRFVGSVGLRRELRNKTAACGFDFQLARSLLGIERVLGRE
jgi:hypothetical protein